MHRCVPAQCKRKVNGQYVTEAKARETSFSAARIVVTVLLYCSKLHQAGVLYTNTVKVQIGCCNITLGFQRYP